MTVVYYPTIQYNTEILRLAIAGTERNIHMQQRTKNRIVVILILLFIFISGILLGIFGERFFAASRVTDYGRIKYYASYTVRTDDTLWTIAGDLMPYNPEYQDVRQYVEEIRRLKKTCGDHILKVIVETCYLTEEEKIAMCKAVTRAGADYIKTSTGFGTGGAVREDVELFKKHIGPDVKIKAAGGVSTLEDLEMFLSLGCDRIGTSKAVGLLKGEAVEGY